MRKILCLFLLVLIMCLTSCTNARTMTIRPSELTEEDKKVLELSDDKFICVDYMLDETVKSTSINLWFYKDGEWIEAGKRYGNTQHFKNKIVIGLTDDTYDLCEITENGHSKCSYKSNRDFLESHMAVTYHTKESQKITLNEEIPLWIKIGGEEEGIGLTHKDFRDARCTAGVAITVTFSDKEVD